MNRKTATAQWHGNLKEGDGEIRFGAKDPVQRGFTAQTRFEGDGFSPEELIAAAHAGCFSMALSHILSEEKTVPQQVQTQAEVSLEEDSGGFSITRIHLETRVTAPGLDESDLRALAQKAAENCPVSKALAGAQIDVNAVLENA